MTDADGATTHYIAHFVDISEPDYPVYQSVDWGIIGKTVLLGLILFLWMYLFEGFFQWAIGQEFRFA